MNIFYDLLPLPDQTNHIMKNFTLFFVIYISIISSGYSQSAVWTDPVAVTDSLTNNVNINLPDMFGSNSDTAIYSVWEKTIDTHTTAIYGRNLITMGEPFVILSQPNVQFRHPVIRNWISGDTVLLVLYETNMNGNWDIYYSKYLKNGTVSPPVPVCNSAENEMNFKFHDSFGIVWEQNGAIMFKNFVIGGFPSPVITVTIDQGNCHNPVLSYNYCAWQKVVGTDTTIMQAQYNYSGSSWYSPLLVAQGINKNLSVGPGDDSYLTWQAKEGGKWVSKAVDLFDGLPYTTANFPGSNNIYPTFLNTLIITKQGITFLPSYFSFASDVTGNYEIYVNQVYWDTNYFNISNHQTFNIHPNFFSSMTYMYGYQTVFLCWESFRNNHWQIWMSHVDIAMGLNDQSSSGLAGLENFPNPFSQSTTITYELASESYSSIIITNMMGERIRILKEGREGQGKHSLTWDGKDSNGNHVAPGIYLCLMKVNDRFMQRKISVL